MLMDININTRNIGYKERRYIEELRILTRSVALDCIIDERFDRIIYIIKKGDMGLAIGKSGENIKKMQKVLGRKVEMVEFDENRDSFIRNIFKPADISEIFYHDEKKIDILLKSKSDLGIVIGKGGCNIEKARMVCRRIVGCEIGEVNTAGQ
jgi:transcription termination/antitermination protein NusA